MSGIRRTAALWILIVTVGCTRPASPDHLAGDLPGEPKPYELEVAQVSTGGRASGERAKDPGPADAQVLNWVAFEGGTVGDRPFSGGRVLLWESEPGRLTAQAFLGSEAEGWKAAGVVSHLVTGEERPLYATATLLNDVVEDERRVPLWTFYGKANDARIESIRIVFPGSPIIQRDVGAGGTWLIVYQGIIDYGPPHEVTVVALDGRGQDVFHQQLSLR